MLLPANWWNVIGKLANDYALIIIFIVAFIYIVNRYFIRHKWGIYAITFPMLLFIILVKDLIKNELSVFDSKVYGFIAGFISKNMTNLMRILTYLGSGWVLFIISLFIIAFLWRYNKYSLYGWMILLNLGASSLLNQIFKFIFHRQRPNILRLIEINGFSFPSGHSMTGMSFYGLIIFLCLKYLKHWTKYVLAGALSLLVLSIGVSRIYLGVHYASDVLAGFSVGFAWLVVFTKLSGKIAATWGIKIGFKNPRRKLQ
jgi:Membrane-associated phospholipid phosphatase